MPKQLLLLSPSPTIIAPVLSGYGGYNEIYNGNYTVRPAVPPCPQSQSRPVSFPFINLLSSSFARN